MSSPKHIAIIMDGNGRWAQLKGRPRAFGHIKGARVARKIISYCATHNVKRLTLYTFSTENWLRPKDEVNFLMRLLHRHIKKEREKLVRENVKFSIIGDLTKLPATVVEEVQKTIQATQGNTGLELVFALNYGGRQELTGIFKDLAVEVAEGKLETSQISEALINERLSKSVCAEPDLIIRTSGEQRLSNFMIWQSAYSELYFTPTLWPDFTEVDLGLAILDFQRRQRRFGQTSAQIKSIDIQV